MKPNERGRLAYVLVRLAAVLVPRARRKDWHREWLAELDAWCAAGRPLIGSALGAFPHALFLTWEEWTMRLGRLEADIRVGIRALLRRPSFTLAVVATLAMGIGPTIAVFSVVEAVLLRPLPYPEGDRILALGEPGDDNTVGTTGFTTARDWAERTRSLSELAILRFSQATVTGAGDPESVAGMRVSSSYFDVIGVQPALGRSFLPKEDGADAERVIVLSHGLWARRYDSDPAVIGRGITLSDSDYTVVGVMPPDYEDLASSTYYTRAQYWTPLRYEPEMSSACRTCRHLRVLARLVPDATLDGARTELAGVMGSLASEHPDAYPRPAIAVEPFHHVIVGPVHTPLRVLLGTVSLVLIIACANVASLMLSRSTDQAREVAVRSALGASRSDLISRAGIEGAILALAGGLAGGALGALGAQLLVSFAPPGVPRLEHVALDATVVAFSLGVTLLTALVVGMAPVIHGAQTGPSETLKEGGRNSAGQARQRVRGVLVVADVAIALLLLSGVGLTLRSFVGVTHVDPGFDTSGVVHVPVIPAGPEYDVEESILAFHRQVLENVRTIPAVASAGLASQVPLGGNFDRIGMDIEGRDDVDPAARPEAERYVVAGDYLETMGIPLLDGRTIDEDDDELASYVAIVNQAFAERWFPEGGAIGARIRPGGPDDPWRTIVGIAGNVRHYALEVPVQPQIYIPQAQWATGYMTLVVRSRDEAAAGLLEALRGAVWSVDRDIPVSGMAAFDDLISEATAERRFVLGLLGAFALAALLLASVGIYGLLTQYVAQRTQEISIRVALGAGRADIFRMVVGRGLGLTLVGVGVGLLGALRLTGILSGMLYEVEPNDPATLMSVAAIMLGIALLASWLPARRATCLDAQRTLAGQ